MLLLNTLLPSKTFLCVHRFFLLVILLSFSSHTFLWACRSLREPQKYFFKLSFMHSLCSPITHSFLSQTRISASPMYPLPVILFSSRNKHLNVFEKAITLQVDSCHNLDPRQMICISFEMHHVY